MDGVLFLMLMLLVFPGTLGEQIAKVVKAYNRKMKEKE